MTHIGQSTATGRYSLPASPLVSVIIPVYNKGAYVRECLESIRRQSYKLLEVICVDDGSEDGSSEVLRELASLDCRFRIVENHRRQGAGSARNRGLEVAKGDAVMFVDADDWLDDNAVQVLVNVGARTRVPIVRGSIDVHRPSGVERTPGWAIDRDGFGPPMGDDGTLLAPLVGLVGCIFEARFLHDHGLRFGNLSAGEDIVFLARCMIAAEAMAVTEYVVYHYRQDPPSVYRTQRQLDDEIAAHAEIRDRLIAAGRSIVWQSSQGGDLARYYFMSLFGRGIHVRLRLRVARELDKLLASGPSPAVKSRLVLALRLTSGVAFGRNYARIERAARGIRQSARRVRRRLIRLPFVIYGLAPQWVRVAWRRYRIRGAASESIGGDRLLRRP